MSRILKLSLLVFVIVATSAMVMAQSTVSGAISGSVSNPNKELVPGAAVTILNTETNQEETATTDDQGQFRISNLQPGSYTVTINAAGFGSFSQPAVVEVGRVTEVNAVLS